LDDVQVSGEFHQGVPVGAVQRSQSSAAARAARYRQIALWRRLDFLWEPESFDFDACEIEDQCKASIRALCVFD
jgi:hypothetical protein